MKIDNIILISITKDELRDILRGVVREELNCKQEKELLNSKDVCEFLGIHLSTLNKWKAENKIPYLKMGKRIFFKRQDVLDALESSNYSKFKELSQAL